MTVLCVFQLLAQAKNPAFPLGAGITAPGGGSLAVLDQGQIGVSPRLQPTLDKKEPIQSLRPEETGSAQGIIAVLTAENHILCLVFCHLLLPRTNALRGDIGGTQNMSLADRKSTRLNSSHSQQSRMPSSA